MKPRKTPSFRKKGPELPTDLPPPSHEGTIERKHTQQVGGKKAAIRSWNSYYAALCGSLLIFFKDKKGREDLKLTSSMPPPLNLDGAICRVASEHKGRKNVFELKSPDGAEFLFEVATPAERDEWVNQFRKAAGTPSIPDISFIPPDAASLNSEHEAEMIDAPPVPLAPLPTGNNSNTLPQHTRGPNDGDNVSTYSNESDTGSVNLRPSNTLPANFQRASTVSSDGEEGEKKKKKGGFGSFLKKKKDKS